MIKIKMPKFKSEDEEAQWWYDNREEHSRLMAKAVAKGQTTTLAEVFARHGIKTSLPVPIDSSDIARAQKLAKKRGVRYEALVNKLLHEALIREEKRLAS